MRPLGGDLFEAGLLLLLLVSRERLVVNRHESAEGAAVENNTLECAAGVSRLGSEDMGLDTPDPGIIFGMLPTDLVGLDGLTDDLARVLRAQRDSRKEKDSRSHENRDVPCRAKFPVVSGPHDIIDSIMDWKTVLQSPFFTVTLPIVMTMIVGIVVQKKRLDDLRADMNRQFDALNCRLDR